MVTDDEIRDWLVSCKWDEPIEFKGDLVRAPQTVGHAVWRRASLEAFRNGDFAAISLDTRQSGYPKWEDEA